MPTPTKSYTLHALTTSLCSHCLEAIPAKVILERGAVYLLKQCPEHGEHRELLEEDAAYYLARTDYDKPGTPSVTQTVSEHGCPRDCGLCPDHDQHTCIGLLEVTDHCDLQCPVCFADAEAGSFVPLPTIERMLDALQAAEGGQAQVVQISGGEPTAHPQILEIIRLVKAKGIRYVMLNTNGLRIAEDMDFVRALGELHGGFDVYLQFDGFDARTHTQLRGRDLGEIKQRAIANLAAHQVPITLVATIAQGVNDHEVGHIVEFGMNTHGIRGVNFQPVAYFGRHPGTPAADRVTLTGILRRIDAQTHGMLRMSDFIPLPCNVDRVAVTYMYRSGGGFLPVTRHAKLRNYLPLIDNTLAFYAEDILREAAKGLACGDTFCSCLSFLKDFLPAVPIGVKGLLSRDRVQFTTDNFFRITVTSFLDRYNFEMRAMKKECVHVLTPDGRRIPFSAYNILYRERERVHA